MSRSEDWPADAPVHAHRADVLARIFREMALQVVLPDPQPWGSDEVDPDPLSPESLAAQTSRLLTLIECARDQNDLSLLHSLRRELLLTRWALVKSRQVRSRGAAGKRVALHAQDSRQDPSDQRALSQHHGRRSETSPACVPTATSTPTAP